MLPVIPKPAISPVQKKIAVAIAGTADFVQIILFPWMFPGIASPLNDAIDFMTAAILIAVCGFKWQFMLAFALELTPMLDLFPTWTAVALTLSTNAPSGSSDGRVNVTPAPPVQTQVPGHGPIEVNAVVVPPVQNDVKNS